MATRRVLPAVPQVTAEEVQVAKAACANYRRLCCALERAEKARDLALSQIFSRIGFSLEEVKGMSPERLGAEIQKRAGVAFSFDSPGSSDFAILKVSADRFPAWKDQFVARVGRAIAAEVENSTRTQYSYDLVDRPREESCSCGQKFHTAECRIWTKRPDVIYLPKRAANANSGALPPVKRDDRRN